VLLLSTELTAEIVAKLRAAGCIYAEEEARLLISHAGTQHELVTMVETRAAGFPLEHILGWAEFCGARVAVTPGVFVPRRRTALLVRQAIALIQQDAQNIVLDICCGSGAVAAVLAASLENIQLHAVDVDAAAVECARRNIKNGFVHEGHLYEPLPAALQGRVDLIVANAPYVPTSEICMLPPEARLHEPLHALDGGRDGLEVQREIIAEAPHWLRRGAHVIIETGEHQSERTAEIFTSTGFDAKVVRSEELDATVVVGGYVGGATGDGGFG
jgi:release factor glutamine methyltransferase